MKGPRLDVTHGQALAKSSDERAPSSLHAKLTSVNAGQDVQVPDVSIN
jgi:hypothetical protein